MRTNATIKSIVIAILLMGVVLCQYGYDATRTIVPLGLPQSLSPGFIHIVDMGFDSTVSSFLWAATMPEILDLFNGRTEYLSDRSFVSAVDPRLGYPYAYSVLALPAVTKFPDALTDAQAIGQEGIAQADPDWRIPYYMAMNYFIGLKDSQDALRYFDIAARTPGIPEFAERFSLNFGIGSNEREKTKELWATIRDSTNDELEKERAQAYIDRLDIFDYLEAASKAYKERYGSYPTSTDALVTKGIIPLVPPDPFGFTFIIKSDGTAGIDLTKPPTVPQ